MSSYNKQLEYLTLALEQARKCESLPSAFCVGAVLVDDTKNTVITTGYTLELPGNTHAEQNCLAKLLSAESAKTEPPAIHPDEAMGEVGETTYSLYTTVEPCSKRVSGNIPCTDLILTYNESQDRKKKGLGRIKTVFIGVKEPDTFIKKNVGREKLIDNGVEYIHVHGLEREILEVALKGHAQALPYQ